MQRKRKLSLQNCWLGLCDGATHELRKNLRKQLAADRCAAPVPTAELRSKLAEFDQVVARRDSRPRECVMQPNAMELLEGAFGMALQTP